MKSLNKHWASPDYLQHVLGIPWPSTTYTEPPVDHLQHVLDIPWL